MHTIRLQGPWRYQLVNRCPPAAADSDADAEPVRTEVEVRVPIAWTAVIDPCFRGSVIWRRRFRCPTGLSPRAQVVMAIENQPSAAGVTLNGHVLQPMTVNSGGQFDIHACLRPVNHIQLQVPVDTDTAASKLCQVEFGGARLEIED